MITITKKNKIRYFIFLRQSLLIFILLLLSMFQQVQAQTFSCQKFAGLAGVGCQTNNVCPDGYVSTLPDGSTCYSYEHDTCPINQLYPCVKIVSCTANLEFCNENLLSKCNSLGNGVAGEPIDCEKTVQVCVDTPTPHCESADCSSPGACNPDCETSLDCKAHPTTKACYCVPGYGNECEVCMATPGNTPAECKDVCSGAAPPPGGTGWTGSPGSLLIDIDSLINNTLGLMGFKFTGENAKLGPIVTGSLNILYGLAGVGLLFYIIRCGFGYLASGGDPKKAEAAKNCLTSSIMGFVLVICAFWITQIVNYVFGLGGTFQ